MSRYERIARAVAALAFVVLAFGEVGPEPGQQRWAAGAACLYLAYCCAWPAVSRRNARRGEDKEIR